MYNPLPSIPNRKVSSSKKSYNNKKLRSLSMKYQTVDLTNNNNNTNNSHNDPHEFSSFSSKIKSKRNNTSNILPSLI